MDNSNGNRGHRDPHRDRGMMIRNRHYSGEKMQNWAQYKKIQKVLGTFKIKLYKNFIKESEIVTIKVRKCRGEPIKIGHKLKKKIKQVHTQYLQNQALQKVRKKLGKVNTT